MSSEQRAWGERGGWFRRTAFPLFLMLVCPPTAILVWMAAVPFRGSLSALVSAGPERLAALIPWPTGRAVAVIAVFAAVQAVLLVALPGRTHYGPLTPMGNRPRYKLNGVPAFFVTIGLFFAGGYGLRWFSPGIVYEELGPLLMTLNLTALLLCVLLYVKGRWFPSTSDAGTSGNLIFDYYWGVELHPTAFGINLKQYINCRVAMMGWAVMLLSYAAEQHALTGSVSNAMALSVGLQLVYIFKFFVWESGYFGSLDIMHDRFGFYICWGILVWLPSVYTLVGAYLVGHPIDWPLPFVLGVGALGLFAIWANYDADAQRQRVRATEGKTTVWGRPPAVIRAEYVTGDGEPHESLLLTNGWWGVARHFHYVAEIALALAWTLPAGFDHPLPYFYVVFLTILLTERARRDDHRCHEKYGRYWEEYCERVPYRIVPGVY